MSEALVIGGLRIEEAKLAALNELLRRYAGDAEGMPLYKVSWASDDNRGLARRHLPGCSKVNPFDWLCDCPLENPELLPRCFHENQESYHLLSWEPPSRALLSYEVQTKEDYSRGTYSCLLHFLDPQTKKPLDPTGVIIEKMVPVLRELREADQAARHGLNAVLQRERQKKIDAERERQRLEEKRYHEFAEQIFEETTYIAHDGNVRAIPKKEEPC